MKVEILGDGCAKCKALKKKVQQAVEELGIHAEVVSVMDPMRLAELSALSLPQLAVDETLAPGSLGSVEEIKKTLVSASKPD